MPPKKSNLNNASTRAARRRRVERAQQLPEQIETRNAAQRIRTAESRAQVAFCFVRSCPNQGPKTEDKRIRFYHFPKDVWMAQQWIEAADNPKYKQEYSRHYRICSVHFEQRYKRSHPHEVAYGLPTPKTFRGISADAVPTLFLPEKLCPNIDPFKDIEDTTVKIERVESEDEVLGTKEEMARLMMELENQKKENEKLMGLYLNI